MNFVSSLNQLASCVMYVASCGGAARAEQLQVLSAGAIEPGIGPAARRVFVKPGGQAAVCRSRHHQSMPDECVMNAR